MAPSWSKSTPKPTSLPATMRSRIWFATSIADVALSTDGSVESCVCRDLSGRLGKSITDTIKDADRVPYRREHEPAPFRFPWMDGDCGYLCPQRRRRRSWQARRHLLPSRPTGDKDARAPSAVRSPCMSLRPTRLRWTSPISIEADRRARTCDLLRTGARVRQAGKHHREDGRRPACASSTRKSVFVKQAFCHQSRPDGRRRRKAEAEKDIGAPAKIVQPSRALQLGEGIEKEESDFAAEVAAAAKG
jgi:elongation factor Ts